MLLTLLLVVGISLIIFSILSILLGLWLISLGLFFVALGFLITWNSKKDKKTNESLRLAKIKDMKEEGDEYLITVSYSPMNDLNLEECVIQTNKKPNKTEVIIECLEDEVVLYKPDIKDELIASVCWIIGAILCVIG